MIPYLAEPVLVVGSVRISAFAVLVVASVCTGFAVVSRFAPRFGLARPVAERTVVWTILLGFVGSRVVELAAYHPELLVERPLELLRIWGGMSSYGGIAGGIAGALVVMWRRGLSRAEMLRFFDLVAFAFPFAWVLGRAGCSLRHDHLGVASESLLAVSFPDGPRFDLGLLELLLTIPIAGGFAWLSRRPRPSGFYLALFFTIYGPARFGLDALRSGDPRYLGWTPGQYASVIAGLAGTAGLLAILRSRSR